MREEEAALEAGIQQQGNVTAGKGSDGFPFSGKGSFLPVTPPACPQALEFVWSQEMSGEISWEMGKDPGGIRECPESGKKTEMRHL